MTRYLTLAEVLRIHEVVLAIDGGSAGLRDLNGLESAIAQPQMSFDDQELYVSLTEKTAALGFSLIQNHPFVDGNKRVGHAAMEVFLVLNGYEILADVDEQERVVLGIATGAYSRDFLRDWVESHITPTQT